jgi:glycosyltransferase involved in cell wall biosynthesis
VLLVGGPPFNMNIGAGVTLTGLFGGWPRTHLADAYEGDGAYDTAICDRFHSLDRFPGAPSNKWLRQAQILSRLARRRADSSVFVGRVSRGLAEFVEEFQPEALFIELSSLSAIDVVIELSRRYRLPIAVHVPDDWMPTWPRYQYRSPAHRPVVEFLNWRLQRRVKALMRDASAHLAISQSLADTLAARHGRPFHVAYNAADPARWPDIAPRDVPSGEPLRIVYSGSIFSYGQTQSLVETAHAVARLAASGLPVRLDIYSQHHDDAEIRAAIQPGPAVGLYPLVAREALGDNLRAADVLLLPTNFDQTTVDFIRYSMPGKMAEYLMAGRALLAYGPMEVEQVRFVREHDCAVVVSEHRPAALEEAIRTLVEDARLRSRLASRARAVGLEVFDLRRVRANFERVMTAMVRGTI